jgi:hypothetical protein
LSKHRGRVVPLIPGRGDAVELWVNQDVAEIFFGVGAEVLSEEVIAELVARGWPRRDLEELGAAGAQYSRARDSIVFPLEFSSL